MTNNTPKSKTHWTIITIVVGWMLTAGGMIWAFGDDRRAIIAEVKRNETRLADHSHILQDHEGRMRTLEQMVAADIATIKQSLLNIEKRLDRAQQQ